MVEYTYDARGSPKRSMSFLGGIYGGISAAANNQNVLVGITIGAVVRGLTGLITEVASVPLMLLGTFVVGAASAIYNDPSESSFVLY